MHDRKLEPPGKLLADIVPCLVIVRIREPQRQAVWCERRFNQTYFIGQNQRRAFGRGYHPFPSTVSLNGILRTEVLIALLQQAVDGVEAAVFEGNAKLDRLLSALALKQT